MKVSDRNTYSDMRVNSTQINLLTDILGCIPDILNDESHEEHMEIFNYLSDMDNDDNDDIYHCVKDIKSEDKTMTLEMYRNGNIRSIPMFKVKNHKLNEFVYRLENHDVNIDEDEFCLSYTGDDKKTYYMYFGKHGLRDLYYLNIDSMQYNLSYDMVIKLFMTNLDLWVSKI